RAMYCSTRDRDVSRPDVMRCCRSAMVASSRENGVDGCVCARATQAKHSVASMMVRRMRQMITSLSLTEAILLSPLSGERSLRDECLDLIRGACAGGPRGFLAAGGHRGGADA